jgi:peptidoglycan hydrolase-like protein with peptidoglycan-binding domain
VLYKGTVAILFSAALVVTPAFATTKTHKPPTTRKGQAAHVITSSTRSRSSHTTRAKSHKLHGQQAIEPSRVMEIQQALIREHYFSGEANGNWDATTQAAMQKFQADQGWQTKLIPDSRALKKLGLGPDYSGAINAQGALFIPPAPASTIPPSQVSGFAAAAGVNR